MWVISKYGFASAVAHTDKPGCVLVRARDKGDLEEFSGVRVTAICLDVLKRRLRKIGAPTSGTE
jgi:hypothetical protein